MKKLVLVLIVAALAGIALYFGLSGAGPETAVPEVSIGAAPAEAAAKTAPAQPAQPVQPAEVAEETATGAASPERTVVNQQPGSVLPPEQRCTLSVSLELPAGAPADDQPELIVHLGDADRSELALQLAALQPGDPLPAKVLARTAVSASGSTELALERSEAPVQVLLHARYSFVSAHAPVDVSGERASTHLKAQLGAWVSGRLLPPLGASEAQRDLAKTSIELRSDPMAGLGGAGGFDESKLLSRGTSCQADGSFELRGVPAMKGLTLTGRPDRLAAFKTTIAEARPGEHVVVSVPLSLGALLLGKVVDDSGAGVARAKLEARADALMFGFGGRVLRKGETGADGSFQLEAVAGGKLMLDAKLDGYLDTTQNFEVADGASLRDIVLILDRGNRISGKVSWSDGTPAADVKVDVSFDRAAMIGMGAFDAARGGKGDGRSNAQGEFTVVGLGKGPFTVQARHVAADELGSSATIDGVKPGTLDLRLVLLPSSAISGRVVDDTGAAVEKCSVEIARKSNNPWIPGEGQRTVAVDDANGAFHIEAVDPGAHTLTARDASGFKSAPMDIVLPREEGAGEVLLTLPRPASVSGRVLLPDGSPAAGAKVKQQMDLASMQSGGRLDFENEATSADDGSFTLTSLPMGAVKLLASKDDYAPSESAALTLSPAQTISDVVLTLRIGGTVTGEVYAKDGKPQASARMLAQMPDMRYGQSWSSSDAEGKFEFLHLPPGQWQIMALPSGQGEQQSSASSDDPAAAISQLMDDLKLTMAEVKDGESVHVILGAPPKDPVHVTGRVVSGDQPVAGAMISFMSSDGKSAGSTLASLKMRSTDKDGRFQLDLDHAGSYLISVQKVSTTGSQQSIELPREVPEAPECNMEFELPVGAISGRVTGADGTAVVGARVSLSVDGPVPAATLVGGRFSEIATDERGEYLLEWLAPGRYSVAAGGAPFGAVFSDKSPLARQVHDNIEVGKGQRISGVDFVLSAGCELQGKLLDSNGKPVADAGIFIRDEQGRIVERISMSVSDSSGGFRVRGLGAGRYTVGARSEKLASRTDVSVILREAEPATVELQLEAGTILLVSVSGKDGAAIEASFSVVDEHGRQVNGMYSMGDLMRLLTQGGFDAKQQRVGPLPPGKYKVTAIAPDGSKTTKPVTLSGQAERKVKLELED